MRRLFVFTNSFIDSGMANVTQTLKMASAFAKVFEVDVHMRGQGIRAYEKLAASVVGGRTDFNLVVTEQSRAYNVLKLAARIVGHSPRPFLYTRSLIVGSAGAFFCERVLVELHQDRLTRFNFLTRLICFTLQLTYFKKRMRIIVISDALKKTLLKKYSIADEFSVMHDAADPQAPSMLALEKRQRPLVVYTGKVDEERSVDKIIALAKVFGQLDFRILGGDPEITRTIRESITRAGLKNVKVFRRQGAKRVSFYQCKADILLGFWSHRVPTMSYCSPLKVFEYLHTGNKILLHDFGVLHEVVPQHDLIEYCDPEDFSSHISALDRLLKREVTQENRAELIKAAGDYTYTKRASALATMALSE